MSGRFTPGREHAVAVGIVLGLLAARFALASNLGTLADEVYYRCWADAPALGYYDQPPMIAWLLAPLASTTSALVLRLPALLCGAAAALVLLPFATTPWRWAAAWACPALFGLTLAVTPDAPLLFGWCLALAGALAGGPWWLVAGLGAGIAFLSKYTGLAVLPLAILGAGPADWRTPWPWAGAGLFAALIAPNVAWNLTHEGVSFGFQLHEGLVNDHAPGVAGPLQLALDQLGVVGPVLVLAALAAVAFAQRPWDRATRVLVVPSLGTLAVFVAASPFAPPEAHWPAPAWVGLLLLLARSGPRVHRAADVGLALAGGATTALALGALGVVWSPPAFRDRFAEGDLLVDGVRSWALPATSEAPRDPTPVFAERYQEVAFLRTAGLPAWRMASCGRADEFTRADVPPRVPALFVRPWRSGPLTCVGGDWEVADGPHDLDGIDATGHRVGRWQVFTLNPVPP